MMTTERLAELLFQLADIASENEGDPEGFWRSFDMKFDDVDFIFERLRSKFESDLATGMTLSLALGVLIGREEWEPSLEDMTP